MKEDMEKEKEKESWYPGKFIASRRKSNHSGNISSSPSDTGKSSNGLKNKDDTFKGSGKSNKDEQRVSLDINFEGDSLDLLADVDYASFPVVGKVDIYIKEFRYLNDFTSPRAIVQFESSSVNLDQLEYVGKEKDLLISFDVREVTSDIVILLFDDFHVKTDAKGDIAPKGRVIIPLSYFYGYSKPREANWEWRQIFPAGHFSRQYDAFQNRFRSGLEHVDDSAMTRSKCSLGFVRIRAEVVFTEPLLRLYCSDGLIRPLSDQRGRIENFDDKNDSSIAYLTRIRRDISRLQKMITAPSLISTFLSVPEVFILIGTFYFLCTSVRGYAVPIALMVLVFINGMLTHSDRYCKDCIVWNDPVAQTRNMNIQNGSIPEDPSQASSKELIASVQYLINSCGEISSFLKDISYYATALEKWSNIWSFADSRISLLAYGVTFSLAVVSSLFILVINWNRYLFVIGSLLCLFVASKENILDASSYLSNRVKLTSAGTDRLSFSQPSSQVDVSAHDTLDKVKISIVIACENIGIFIRQLENLWLRIPDENDIYHQYISSLSIVKETGAEMKDAEAEFLKKNASN